MRGFLKKFAALVLVLLAAAFVFAADDSSSNANKELNVQVNQLVDRKYPNFKAYVTVEKPDGTPLAALGSDAFKVTIDNGKTGVGKIGVSVFKNTSEGVNYNIVFPVNLQKATMSIQATAIVNFVDLMTEKDKISIYSMGDTITPVVEDVAQKEFQADMISTFEGSADKAPRIYDSLQALVNLVAKKDSDRKVIIVVSDERDNNSITPARQFMTAIEQANIPIFTIGIRAPSTSTQVRMEDISYATNGKYYYTPMIRDLSSTLSKVIDVVSDSYILDFRAKIGVIGFLKGGDGLLHDLSLEVDVRDGYGRSAKKFTAIKKTIPIYLWIGIGIVVIIVVIIAVMVSLLSKKKSRESMGITDRRCPDCGNRMKDSWDECPFCKYLPEYLGGQPGASGGDGGFDVKGMGDKAKGAAGKAKGAVGKAKGAAGKAKGGLGKIFGIFSKFKK
ncbi:MAG TPA: hypothetical protein DCO86_04455 [Spirochaetaceae bacterium]|nr:hypothetical protein [Spirochaetaceae bacterium]